MNSVVPYQLLRALLKALVTCSVVVVLFRGAYSVLDILDCSRQEVVARRLGISILELLTMEIENSGYPVAQLRETMEAAASGRQPGGGASRTVLKKII